MWNLAKVPKISFDETCPDAALSSMTEEQDSVLVSDLIGDSMNEPHWQGDGTERRISAKFKSSIQNLSILRKISSIPMDEKDMSMPPRDSSIRNLKESLSRSMSLSEMIADDIGIPEKISGVPYLRVRTLIAAAIIIALLYAIVTMPVMTFFVITFVFLAMKKYIEYKYNAEAEKRRKLMKDKRV